jgi:hypothetical protein
MRFDNSWTHEHALEVKKEQVLGKADFEEIRISEIRANQ